MLTVLFVISMLCCMMFAVGIIGILLGRDMEVPTPLLHKLGINFNSTYISSPAITYQVWFWFSYYNVI